MSLDFRFRLLVFGQVLLGIVAFCMAERNPGLLLVAGALGAASWYLTEGPHGRPLPRWLVNAGSLVAMVVMGYELVARRGNLIVAMGHFTMALQVLMLYARKSNREYSMLLVLSLIQMIGASVLSVSIVYGLLLAAYCALALVTVLMFQLKSTGDWVNERNHAATPAGARPRVVAPVSGRGLRWHLRGMWLVLGVVSSLVASTVFVLLPRNSDMRRIALNGEESVLTKQTGFSPVVNLASGAPGAGSTEAVLTMAITQFDEDAGHENRGFLLRGAALDRYDPSSQTWSRSSAAAQHDRTVRLPGYAVTLAALPQPATALEATITLRDTSHRVLFTPAEPRLAAGAIGAVASDHLRQVMFNPIDRQLQANDPGGSAWVYTVKVAGTAEGDVQNEYDIRLPAAQPRQSPRAAERAWRSLAALPGVPARYWGLAFALDEPPRGTWGDWRNWNALEAHNPPADAVTLSTPHARRRLGMYPMYNPGRPSVGPPPGGVAADGFQAVYARGWSVEAERIRAFTQEILQAQGIRRDPDQPHTVSDARTASVLCDYLRRHFRYSIDVPRPAQGEDPIVAFLFGHQQGHCELFAAGLVAMCRSVNIPARVVTGYRASEFNELGGYYIVRQSHAHAWAEINGGPGIGWRTFDATPADLVDAEHSLSGPGWWTAARQAYEYLEFTWVKSVVAYDQRTREAVISSLNNHVSGLVDEDQTRLGRAVAWVRDLPLRWRLGTVGYTALSFVLMLALAGVGLLVRKLVIERRRLAALHLESVPRPQARGMARKLRFYLHMIELLERHGYRRPAWQCPAGFAAELAEAHPLRFDPVVALTEIFYEVRFGQRDLDPARQSQVKAHLRQLESAMTQRP